jgi:factor associated with neutral sphingomyelinase activation
MTESASSNSSTYLNDIYQSGSTTSNSLLLSTSENISRFSLILLEPGEIYFEDYLVYYHGTQCPFDPKQQQQQQQQQSSQSNFPMKGKLKVCSKSVVFEPLNLSYPLIKFAYKQIETIQDYNTSNTNSDYSKKESREQLYSLSPTNDNNISNNSIKQKCFALNCKQTVQCKANNQIAPYVTVKQQKIDNKPLLNYFQFIFSNSEDALSLFRQLHRASTLSYEEEDIMLQLILKSHLSRQLKFDLHHLDDIIKEQIQFESEVYKICPLVTNPGRLILTNMCLYYKPFNNLDTEPEITKIKLENIKYVIKRRYHLRKVGCEIIFYQKRNENGFGMGSTVKNYTNRSMPYLYLIFDSEIMRDQFFDKLTIDQKDKLVNLNSYSQGNMLQKWRCG